jgi:GT2 family glycosyltransferase
MDVSIIIVNYNTKDILKQCIESVFAKTQNIEFEVIVVDNASSDGSQQMIKNDFPDIIFIESPENLGFGRANNSGSKYAKGKYLFFLNSDTILLNNAVKILSDFMDNNSKVGICGGNLFNDEIKPVHSYSMFLPSIISELNIFSNVLIEKLLYRKNSYFNHTDIPKNVGYIMGADIMIRAELFNLLNGFDPDFFLYYEETELTYRVKESKYKVINVPQAKIIHLTGKSLSDSEYKLKISFKSRRLYYKKTHNIFSYYIANSIYLLTIVSRCIFYIRNKQQFKHWKILFNCYFSK